MSQGGHTYTLQVADTDAARNRGLAGRKSLPADQGMLFSYARPGRYCFWMKDMRLPLDMVWTDSDRSVVYLKTQVQPSSYPHTFCPDASAKYVIELAAGQAARANIRTGQKLSF